MDIYKTEEEQVAAIKQWWKENAVSLIAGIVIGIAVLGGYRYWDTNKQEQAQQASVIYSEILSSTNDKAEKTKILQADFSGTPYAALATLLLAKDNVNANELDKAVLQLQWVINNNHDEGVEHIAKQRLARLYLAQNKIELAEALIKGVKAEAYSAAYNEIQGDISLAKNLPVQARELYRLALSALPQGDQRYAIIKMKLDDLSQANKAK